MSHFAQDSSKERYSQDFRSCADELQASLISRSSVGPLARSTRAYWHDVQTQKPITFEAIDQLPYDNVLNSAVLVVENLDFEWAVALGHSLEINPTFFVQHASNATGSTPWASVFGKWSANHKKPTRTYEVTGISMHGLPQAHPITKGWHIDGVIHYGLFQQASRPQPAIHDPNFMKRRFGYDEDYGWQSTTRVSYCLAKSWLLLILVDAPMTISGHSTMPNASMRAQLTTPLALNRGGLTLPLLLDQPQLSLFGCFNRFFSHPWHFHVLFAKNMNLELSLSPETIFHLLASSTWSTHLHMLECKVKRVGFEDIRQPTIAINNDLHNQRRDLILLLSQVAITLKWIPPKVNAELEAIKDHLPAAKYIGYPDIILQDITQNALILDKLLMDNFSLLMSSIGVLEAESSKEQMRRGHTLTQLAFVYLPISLITSAFGMNVREINGSPLPIWIAAVALLITAACTIVVFAVLKWWQQSRRKPLWMALYH